MSNTNVHFLLILFIFSTLPKLHAGRRGGDISYQFLSHNEQENTNKYLITFTSLSRCQSGTPNWTNPTYISYYTDDSTLNQAGHEKFPLSLDTFHNVYPILSDCYTDEDLCYHKIVFSREIDLPIINESYHFCKQQSSSLEGVNIENSDFPQGATYYTELTKEAQIVFNSSPIFPDILDIPVCGNLNNSLSFTVENIDQDDLIYEFCELPEGFKIGESPTWCFPLSYPSCPPPFPDFTNYATGFNALFPFGQNVSPSINSSTGIFSFDTLIPGKYLVGICVSEYKNDVLMGKFTRRYIISIAECIPKLQADFEIDSIFSRNDDTIILCNSTDLFFENVSIDSAFITDFSWSFNLNNQVRMLDEWSPLVPFEEAGIYEGKLVINGNPNCTDTSDFNIIVSNNLEANFDFSPDFISHFNPVVNFTNTSTGESILQWEVDNENISFLENPIFTLPDTGLHIAQLTIEDSYGCQDSLSKVIDVVPEIRYFLPTAFSPNSDNSNDIYMGKGVLLGLKKFNLSIWNRYGENIFSTKDPTKGWNGKNRTGNLSPQGNYVCVVKIIDGRGEIHEFRETFLLLK